MSADGFDLGRNSTEHASDLFAATIALLDVLHDARRYSHLETLIALVHAGAVYAHACGVDADKWQALAAEAFTARKPVAVEVA